MRASRFTMGVIGLLLAALCLAWPALAPAANMSSQQALLLLHFAPDGSTFFTTNYAFAATEGPNTSINVKCFSPTLQRVGPAGGVNIHLSNLGQVAQATPTSLQVTTDPLFQQAGFGWCWANNFTSSNGFNVQITIGATRDLGPGGIQNSTSSTFIGTSTGLAEISTGLGGIAFFTTNGVTDNYLVIVNPATTAVTLTLQLFDASGTKKGADLVRSFSGRSLQVFSIPDSYVVPGGRPTSGSVRIAVTDGGPGFLGWLVAVQPSTDRVQFTPIGLALDDSVPLPPASAP